MTVFQRFSQAGRRLAKWMFTLATRRAVSVMVCLLMLAGAGTARATTWWVAPSQANQAYSGEPIGNDSNLGTYSSPWLTFQYAAIHVNTGDTVAFMDGTYPSAGSPPYGDAAVLYVPGRSGSPITFMAQHRGKAILDGEADWLAPQYTSCTGANNYIYLYTASYVVIQGFVIQNTCSTAVQDNDEAHYVTLRWNEIRNVGTGSDSPTTDSFSAFYCGGAQGSGASDVVLDGNSIHDIGRSVNNGLEYFNDQAVYINCPNVTIINNVFYNQNVGTNIQVAGIEEPDQEGAGNVLIANNTFGPLDPGHNNPEYHNPQYGDLYGEITIWRGSSGNGVDGVTIQNNIFNEPQETGHWTAIYGSDPHVSNCVIDANIITNNPTWVYYAVPLSEQGDPGQGCTINEPSTLLDTDAGSAQVMVDPYPDTVYPAAPDFDLVSGSPAIDAGDTIPTVTTDFLGISRPQGSGYDIGAYEYQ